MNIGNPYSYPTGYNQRGYNIAPYNTYQPNIQNTYTSFPTQTTNPFVTQQSNSFVGRVVNNENEITPSEVPMDGTLGIFPKADGSSIFVKTWGKMGEIKTIEYIPAVTETNTSQEEVAINDTFFETIQRLDNRLDRIEKKLNSRKSNSHQYKKENNSDDA